MLQVSSDDESFDEGLSFSFAKIVLYNLSWNSLTNKRSEARLGRNAGVRLCYEKLYCVTFKRDILEGSREFIVCLF